MAFADRVEKSETRCKHKCQAPKRGNKYDTSTLQCQKEVGHEGAHEWKDEETRKSIIWFKEGPPPVIETSTRFRFFKDR